MYDKLFEKGCIGNVEIKNRLVMTPMGTNLAELDGTVGPAMLAYFEARAKGGCGLIMPEICRVNDVHGAGMLRQISATKDIHIPGLAKLASTVHKYGSKIFIQLHHPGREGESSLIGGQPCVSASDRMCNVSKQVTRPLTLDEIHELVGQFGDAALRCKKAGNFAGVGVKYAVNGVRSAVVKVCPELPSALMPILKSTDNPLPGQLNNILWDYVGEHDSLGTGAAQA